MTKNAKKGPKSLATLAAVFLSLIGSQIGSVALASDGGFKPNQPTSNASLTGGQFLIAQNQQCQVNAGADPRQGADIRNNPTGQNTGFVNNGTSVTAQQWSNDGQWRWVVTSNGQQGWMYNAYLTNCGDDNRTGSNTTGGVAIGTICLAQGSPQYPTIPIRDFPNARSNEIGNFTKGTQLRVTTPPPGQQSQRKWTYVESVQNPAQKGWVWTTYLNCN